MWRKLAVDVLGYKRFGAQGGDWGAPITIALAHDHADVVGAFHLNLLFLRPSGQLSPDETQWYAMAADGFRSVSGGNARAATARGRRQGVQCRALDNHAAWEQPEDFSSEVASFFDQWR